MTPTIWGPEKGRTASKKTDGLCEREMNRGGCADMWVSPPCFTYVVVVTLLNKQIKIQ